MGNEKKIATTQIQNKTKQIIPRMKGRQGHDRSARGIETAIADDRDREAGQPEVRFDPEAASAAAGGAHAARFCDRGRR
jgi:hypothetical protein